MKKCDSCCYLFETLHRLVVPDGPEDGMLLMVCHDCLGENDDD